MKKNCIGFIFGGDSAENEVSIVTTLGLEKLMKGVSTFTPEFIYISTDNKFFYVKRKDMNVDYFKSENVIKSENEILILHGGDIVYKNRVLNKKLFHLNAIINCCHGGYGENGALAGYMQMCSIPFSTFSSTALGISMDKNLFKHIMKSVGVLVPSWIVIYKKDWKDDKSEVIEKIQGLKFPVIVKPNSSGSSLGITVVKNIDELYSSLDVAFEFDNTLIVEKLVENKVEFNCCVLGGSKEMIVSDVDQIEEKGDMFTFSDKYIGDSSSSKNNTMKSSSKKSVSGMESAKRLLPAPITVSLKDKIQESSAIVFKTLGLSGISRVDFLYDQKKKKLYVGEVNAVPGSLALYFFKNTKIGVLGVINKLINIALEEYNSKVKVDDKFIPKIFRV